MNKDQDYHTWGDDELECRVAELTREIDESFIYNNNTKEFNAFNAMVSELALITDIIKQREKENK